MSENTDPRVGTVVGGRYKITGRVASGGMGVVYKGERLQLGRAFAIKFLHEAYAGRPEILARFNTEAHAMGRLSHPHCVSVLDYGVEEGSPYVVMDFVHGKTLRDLLDEGPVPPARALHITRQVLAGLAHAHGQGIVHRDIKPANIMLTEATGTGDHVRILDFGLAKLRDVSGGGKQNDSSMAQLAIGTPSYMPPEQARGERVDARSDVYSVGVMLFELLTGRKPFESDRALEVISMHANVPAPRLREMAPEAGYSQALEDVVWKAMEKDPARRFESAADFVDALDATPESETGMRRSSSVSAATAPGTASEGKGDRRLAYTETRAMLTEPPKAPRRSQAILLGVTLVGMAVCAWFAVSRLSAKEPPPAPPPRPLAFPLTNKRPAAPPASSAAAPAPAPPPTPVASSAAPEIAPEIAVSERAQPGDDVPLAERREPVPEVKSDPVPDENIDTQPPPVPPAATPGKVDDVADVEQLIAAGKREEAIAGLLKLRKQSPKSAYLPYLLGGLYFEKLWWTEGMGSYEDALQLNRGYARREPLIRNAIRALSSDKTTKRAATLLRQVGAPALPYLRQAAKSDPNANVRARAGLLTKVVGKVK